MGDDDANSIGLGERSHGDVQLLGDAVGGVDVEAALQAQEESPSRSPWGQGTEGTDSPINSWWMLGSDP